VDHLDFEIEIDQPTGQDYPVTVVHSPAGEGRATMKFPYDELALQNRLQALQLALLGSGRGQRRIVPPQEATVREFGTSLYNALFSGEVRSLLDVSRSQARSSGQALRIKLRCRPAELSALPWEYLFDTDADEFVCLSRLTPLVRYLEVAAPMEPIRVTPPLRILGVVSSPKDLPELDVTREKQRIDDALAHLTSAGLVELSWLPQPTWRALQQTLSRDRWHVFHFIGHGAFDERRQEGVIALEDDAGASHLLGASDLGLLLGDHDDLRLAILNSCEGAKASARDVFSSTAAVLVRKGTPGVVAMQYEITDLAAIELARSFYDSVAHGLPVDTALSEARKAVRLSLPGTLEWGTPVLYMRAADGVLFNVDAAAREHATAVAPASPPLAPAPAAGRTRRLRVPQLPTGRRRWIAAAALVFVALAVAYVVTRPNESGGSKALVAGNAHLLEPKGVAVLANGTVAIADTSHNRIIGVTPQGGVFALAGTGIGGNALNGGVATAAELNYPVAIVEGPAGTIYFSDQGNQTIRQIKDGKITTLRLIPGDANVQASGLAYRNGRLYIATATHVWYVGDGNRLVDVAGTGNKGYNGDGRPATTATLDDVGGIAVAADGTVYIADSGNQRVRRVTPDGMINTVAGGGGGDHAGDGDVAVNGTLSYPGDVALDEHGDLYILDTDRSVSKLNRDGTLSVVFKFSDRDGFTDGPIAQALMRGQPVDFAVDPSGTVFLVDFGNNRVRRVSTDLMVKTIA